MQRRYENILATVGNTPVVKVNALAPTGVHLYVKIEAFNPMGSVKDRLALGVVEEAERSGALQPGQTVVEATSGNTGIGLAMVCAQKGYPLVVTMAENFSIERRKMMRFLGAKVVLTPAAQKGSGMLNKAVELAQRNGWFLTRQFENEANADMHARTTAPEILAAFEGESLDYWVTGYGTGGTLKGVARVLRERSPQTRIIVCEPDNSPLLESGAPQHQNEDGSPAASHPYFRPHLMQGWTPDFISKLTGDAVSAQWIDGVMGISGGDALHFSRELARREGIFVGISAGATFAGAMRVSQTAAPGSRILCMLPDTGERYLSTPLFEDIPEEMTDEEWEISRSTPGNRFDAPQSAPDKPAPAAPAPGNLEEAAAFVDEALADTEQPVTLFALEWCEFCWSIRKMFAHCGIPYRSVDLDSVKYQEGNLGGAIRAVLKDRTGCETIPQIFVGKDFIGGCTETFDAYRSGALQDKLMDAGVQLSEQEELDPYTFLPKWLQPR